MTSDKQFNTAIFIFCALGAVSYLHPYHIHPLRTYYHDALICLGLLIACMTIARTERPVWRFPALLMIPLGIAVLVCLQIVLGIVVDASDLALPLVYFLLCALAMIFGASMAAQTGGAARLCFGLAIMHLLAAMLSLVMQQIQVAGVDATPFVMFISHTAQDTIRPYANVAQPNQLALLYCLALASAWYLYQRFHLSALVGTLLAVLLLWGLALTQSRIGWIITPLFVLICWPKKSDERALDRVLLALLLALYLSFVLGLPQLGQWLGFASGSVAGHVGGRSERLVLLQQAWRMAAEHPWLGVGWFGFCAEQVRIAADFTPTTYAEHAHNWIMNFAAELGWPATITIFSGLLWWAVQTCVLVKASAAVRFASLFLAAVLVHSMVEFPLWYAFVLIPVGVLMGMLHQLRWPAEGVHVPAKLVMTLGMFSCLVFLLITLDYQRVVAGFSVLRNGKGQTNVGKERLIRPSFTLFPEYFAYFELMQLTPKEGMSGAQIAFVERMSQRFGYVHVLNKLAEVYVLNGQGKQAQRTMLTLQRLHPFSYAEYYDYWKAHAILDARYALVLATMPARDSH